MSAMTALGSAEALARLLAWVTLGDLDDED